MAVRTILIVDDDVALLKALESELSTKGFAVVTAMNGLAAYQQAKKMKPDLIIMDVAMPLTNGIMAFKQLRIAPETQSIPVIFLTGLPSKDVYPTVAQGTRVAYLKKPIDMDDLLSVIQQLLPAA